jgi:hypothetical protein
MNVPILSGRGLTAQDGAGRPPVVLINDALARRDFRGINPIGETILLGPGGHRIAMQIVGVVSDIRQFGLDRAPGSQYFHAIVPSGLTWNSICPPWDVVPTHLPGD